MNDAGRFGTTERCGGCVLKTSSSLGWSLRTCISNKLPGNTVYWSGDHLLRATAQWESGLALPGFPISNSLYDLRAMVFFHCLFWFSRHYTTGKHSYRIILIKKILDRNIKSISFAIEISYFLNVGNKCKSF